MNAWWGRGESGVRRVERFVGVGVSRRYLWASTSKVKRSVSTAFVSMSVSFVVKGGIAIETSVLVKLVAFCASWEEVGVVVLQEEKVVRLLRVRVSFEKPPTLLHAGAKRSSTTNSRVVDVTLRIVNGGVAIVELAFGRRLDKCRHRGVLDCAHFQRRLRSAVFLVFALILMYEWQVPGYSFSVYWVEGLLVDSLLRVYPHFPYFHLMCNCPR